ncbi:hypothetical protein ABW20_dc0106285 [Dactylellina cionopaga]|nr:hypothetical protein ABW20_dc0106285 [Dactylellina cionopaga]
MSYPPPPGTSTLPPRPPPSIHASTHAFAAFKPRQVASSNQSIGAPPTYSGVPGVSIPPSYGISRPPSGQPSAPGYGYGAQAQTSYSAAPQTTYSAAPTANSGYMSQSTHHSQHQYQSQSREYSQSQSGREYGQSQGGREYGQNREYNQSQGGRGGGPRNFQNRNNHNNHNSSFPPMDPEMEAQIAEQQSIYDPARRAALAAQAAVSNTTTTSAGYDPNASLLPEGQTPTTQPQKKETVIRSGGGQTWKDDSLLEWDPAHFRLFVGNLAGEVTDESLLKAFAAYPSVQKARVIRDKRTTKSKGYGFVAFQDGDDYFKAGREMQGKYIGSHPVLLRKSNTEIKPVVQNKKNKYKHKVSGGGGGGGGGSSGGNVVLAKKEGSGELALKFACIGGAQRFTLAPNDFDIVLQDKSQYLAKLGASIDNIIALTTQSGTGPDSIAGNPALRPLVTQAVDAVRTSETLVANYPAAVQRAVDLVGWLRAYPYVQADLKRDIWGARVGEPWFRNIWDVIKDLPDYIENSGAVDTTDPESLMLWLYNGYFDPVVGAYVLDQDAADEIYIAARYLRTELEDAIKQVMAMMVLFYTEAAQSIGPSTAVLNSYTAIQAVNYFVGNYVDTFDVMVEAVEEIFDPPPNDPAAALTRVTSNLGPLAGQPGTLSISVSQQSLPGSGQGANQNSG